MRTLYPGWRSSASRRVRLCLAEDGLAFESRMIDATTMNHHSPAFLSLNPSGVARIEPFTAGQA
jgi:glutathione S-transferase